MCVGFSQLYFKHGDLLVNTTHPLLPRPMPTPVARCRTKKYALVVRNDPLRTHLHEARQADHLRDGNRFRQASVGIRSSGKPREQFGVRPSLRSAGLAEDAGVHTAGLHACTGENLPLSADVLSVGRSFSRPEVEALSQRMVLLVTEAAVVIMMCYKMKNKVFQSRPVVKRSKGGRLFFRQVSLSRATYLFFFAIHTSKGI